MKQTCLFAWKSHSRCDFNRHEHLLPEWHLKMKKCTHGALLTDLSCVKSKESFFRREMKCTKNCFSCACIFMCKILKLKNSLPSWQVKAMTPINTDIFAQNCQLNAWQAKNMIFSCITQEWFLAWIHPAKAATESLTKSKNASCKKTHWFFKQLSVFKFIFCVGTSCHRAKQCFGRNQIVANMRIRGAMKRKSFWVIWLLCPKHEAPSRASWDTRENIVKNLTTDRDRNHVYQWWSTVIDMWDWHVEKITRHLNLAWQLFFVLLSETKKTNMTKWYLDKSKKPFKIRKKENKISSIVSNVFHVLGKKSKKKMNWKKHVKKKRKNKRRQRKRKTCMQMNTTKEKRQERKHWKKKQKKKKEKEREGQNCCIAWQFFAVCMWQCSRSFKWQNLNQFFICLVAIEAINNTIHALKCCALQAKAFMWFSQSTCCTQKKCQFLASSCPVEDCKHQLLQMQS